MSDPYQPGAISVTVKQDEPGGKFNDPKSPGSWIVFHGTPALVREQIIETFGLVASDWNDKPLFTLVAEATKLFKATGNVSRQLGGQVISTGSESQQSASSGGSAWAQAASEPEKSAEEKLKETLLEQVEQQPNVKALKELWAKNQEAFAADELMTAYLAKGKALKEAGLVE